MNHQPEDIAVIGGGLGGCLTALMLAKRGYHVKLIEKQKVLLNGASVIASRLHLGGEYPLDPQTAQDCLDGAVIWKLLMPDSIYTPAPPMKFLLSASTQQQGLDDQASDKTLTVSKYFAAYERIRERYEGIFHKVKVALFGKERDEAKQEDLTRQALFGSYKQGEFSRELKPSEYQDYPNIAGGFQSQEIGLNVPKLLAMIQKELEQRKNAGEIEILTGHEVTELTGEQGHFTIRCKDKAPIHAEQVVQAAWKDGPSIMPELTNGAADHVPPMTVYPRAILRVKLPPQFSIDPAFVMLGDHGGMVSAYNDKMALVYLPTDLGGYFMHSRTEQLTNGHRMLPKDWDQLTPEARDHWTRIYLHQAQMRFPFLKDIPLENAHLIFRSTINFQEEESKRRHQLAEEAEGVPVSSASRTISLGWWPQMGQEQRMEMQQNLDAEPHLPPQEYPEKRGLFTLYPTKGTYAMHAALQVAEMVEQRSRNREEKARISAPTDMLDKVLAQRERYSLAAMAEPNDRDLAKFIGSHPDLDRDMLLDSWPKKFDSMAQAVAERKQINELELQ